MAGSWLGYIRVMKHRDKKTIHSILVRSRQHHFTIEFQSKRKDLRIQKILVRAFWNQSDFELHRVLLEWNFSSIENEMRSDKQVYRLLHRNTTFGGKTIRPSWPITTAKTVRHGKFVSEALDGIVLHFQLLVLCSVEMLQWPYLTTSSAVSLVQYRPSMPQHGGQSGQVGADNANYPLSVAATWPH